MTTAGINFDLDTRITYATISRGRVDIDCTMRSFVELAEFWLLGHPAPNKAQLAMLLFEEFVSGVVWERDRVGARLSEGPRLVSNDLNQGDKT